MNLGAGRVVFQDLQMIFNAIADGSLAKAKALQAHIAALKASGGTCHLMGLLSPGGVHAHQDQIAALAKIVAEAGVPVAVHAYTDGRDTPPRAGADYLRRFLRDIDGLPQTRIATVDGRYYAMDRDKRLGSGWRRPIGAVAEAKGGTAPRRRSPRSRAPTRPTPAMSSSCRNDRRLCRHEGWRRRAVRQFPRRPGARDPAGACWTPPSTASRAPARPLRRCLRPGRVFANS